MKPCPGTLTSRDHGGVLPALTQCRLNLHLSLRPLFEGAIRKLLQRRFSLTAKPTHLLFEHTHLPCYGKGKHRGLPTLSTAPHPSVLGMAPPALSGQGGPLRGPSMAAAPGCSCGRAGKCPSPSGSWQRRAGPAKEAVRAGGSYSGDGGCEEASTTSALPLRASCPHSRAVVADVAKL